MREIQQLISGFEKFRHQYYEGADRLFDRLKNAQSPSVLVISCSDSRVDPALLLDAVPGQLFVVRNVANLVPPRSADGGTHGVSAALEFAVCVLKVRHIIILGHSQCGGIRALLDAASGEFITQWMNIVRAVKPAGDYGHEHVARDCEQQAILLSLKNLLTFPWIAERVDQSEIMLHGWYFDIARGRLEGYDRIANRFEILQHSAD
jgi:carbonic anhydrase